MSRRRRKLSMDQDTHDVFVGKEPIELSPTEFKLLRYLMLNPNRVLSKAQILDHVWEYDFNGDAGIVESYISYLRRKIDPFTDESVIQTKRGFGYMPRKVGKQPAKGAGMARKPDAVTGWWRCISLRANVTASPSPCSRSDSWSPEWARFRCCATHSSRTSRRSSPRSP